MGAFQATVFYLVLCHGCKAIAQDAGWKSATATYSKETDGSIISRIHGYYFLSIYLIVSQICEIVPNTTSIHIQAQTHRHTDTPCCINNYSLQFLQTELVGMATFTGAATESTVRG